MHGGERSAVAGVGGLQQVRRFSPSATTMCSITLVWMVADGRLGSTKPLASGSESTIPCYPGPDIPFPLSNYRF